jgi:hypothetical protein
MLNLHPSTFLKYFSPTIMERILETAGLNLLKIFSSRSAYRFKASFLTLLIHFGFKPLGKLTWYSLIFASNSGLYIFLKITQVKLSSRITSSLILMALSNCQREVNTFNMRKDIPSRLSCASAFQNPSSQSGTGAF